MSTTLKALQKLKSQSQINEADLMESFASRPANKINVPEISNLSCDFVYNFFTRDERVREDDPNVANKVLSLNVDNSEEIFRIQNEKVARYVKLSFKKPSVSSEYYSDDIGELSNETFDNIVDKVVTEGSFSNNIFSGVEFIDTGKEANIYSMLGGSMYFLNVADDRGSNIQNISKLYETLSEKGGLKGQDKKLLRETFKNINPSGYALAQSDVPPDLAKSASDPIGKQTFSVQFNNMFMSDLVREASLIPDNVFQDEIRSLISPAATIKNKILSSINTSNTFSEAEYELEVDAVTYSAVTDVNHNDYPQIKLVGYILEKYEVLPNNQTVFLGRRFIEGYHNSFGVDEKIRYGGSYFYKVRSLCQVKFIGIIDNSEIDSPNQQGLITTLLASEGVINHVYCVENVPPPDVQFLKVKFDYESLFPKLYWQAPVNKQRDIKRFQVFKRLSTAEPFKLVKELNFDNGIIKGASLENISPDDIQFFKYPQTSYLDTTHKEGEKPIYTICCIDAHGMTSNYGPQIMIERNQSTNKTKLSIVSRCGAPKPYPNLYLNVDTFQDAIKTSKHDRATLVFNPEYYDIVKYDDDSESESSLNLLAIDENKFRYKFHFINIDNQKEQTLNVKIKSRGSVAGTDEDFFNVSGASFSKNNFSFQYGI